MLKKQEKRLIFFKKSLLFKYKILKTMNEKSNYTIELNEVLEHMTTVLLNEFPTDVLTPEYLILSILDTKDCHANLILDNCLMSSNIDELKRIYVEVIESHVKPQLKDGEIRFNDELTRILNCANDESQKLNNPQVGTEHVILAILNPQNNFSGRDVFYKFMLQYDFIYGKCNINNDDKQLKLKKLNQRKINKQPNQNIIPLKSQVNTKTISMNGGDTSAVDQYTTNINKLAREGKIDDIIGRTDEIQEIIKTLSRRKKNNAILVGNGGCGKTAIVYGIAKLIEENKVPEVLEGKEIVMLNPMALVSGTHFRGMFEERIKNLFDTLQSSNKYILFIDDIHTVLKSGSKDKDTDISGMIGGILSDGVVKVIGATTFKEYRNAIESNTQLCRKFQKIVIEPASIEDALDVISKNKHYYEEFHNVRYSDKAVEMAVKLADRYVTDRSLPDSAFDIIDLAGARTSLVDRDPIEIQNTKKRMKQIEDEKDNALNNGDFEKIDSLTIEENVLASDLADFKRNLNGLNREIIEINEHDIADVVSEVTKIPVSKLTSDEKSKIAHIDDTLKQTVIGQDEAIDDICKVIKRNRIGLSDGKKCAGTYLLLGRSGVGKTLLAKTIAKEIFGDEKALIRLDMSEYSEKNSVSKLHGTSAGYVGYDDGGVLTNAIKHKPYSVVLLDEIEKADESIYNLFLQVFDEGRLSESNGNVVDCHNCIFIMTSNVGTRKASELGNGLGFVTDETKNKKSIIEKELKKKFTPEFLNRINKIVYFNDLSDNNLKDIVKLEINKFNNKLNNINYNILYSDSVVDYIYAKAVKEKEFGARPIIRLIQDNIEDKVTDLMLEHDYEPNYTFSASCENGQIQIQ